jgi:serine/threonine-protein kinase RsbW
VSSREEPQVTREVFAPRLSSVPAARRWVWRTYSTCCTSGADKNLLELLTTEAVANAVLHGAGEVVVELTCTEQVVRVGVSDASPLLPETRRAGPETIGGHGVALIDTLSSRWGIQTPADGDAGPHPDPRRKSGKTVWFELPTAS